MIFKHYTDEDYEAVCDFLIALNQGDNTHINWNWARFEWMEKHPEFDQSLKGAIGLWQDGGEVVGAAIYDMYFGEAFCAVLPAYGSLYPEVLDYAYRELKDDGGLGVAIGDDNQCEIKAAENAGFTAAEQTETILSIALDQPLPVDLPDGLRIEELDPVKEPGEFQWLLWQGFDHGDDREACRKEEVEIPRNRAHFDLRLSLSAVDASGKKVAYCCLWYSEKTDYAYIEPVCTIPSYRGKGAAKALLYEALNRARSYGAQKAYVISDAAFYLKLGFVRDRHYTFYWKA